MQENNNFGARLKLLRTEKGMTGEELGKVLNFSKSGISNWECRGRFPDEEVLKKLAEYFDVSLDYLLGISDVKKPKQIETNTSKEVRSFTIKLIHELLKNDVIADPNNIPDEITDMIIAALKNDIKTKGTK